MKTPLLALSVFCFFLALSAAGGSGLVLRSGDVSPPGVGLVGVALFDLFLVYSYLTLLLQVIGLGGLAGRVQWLTALVVGIVLAILSFMAVLFTLNLLSLMVALLLAVPFGTAVYMAVYGNFDTSTVRSIIAMVMLLKLVGVGLLLVAAPGVLRNSRLALLTGLSLLFTLALGLLYAYVPGFLVSIADAVGAIVIGVVALVWAGLLVLSGLMSMIRALRGLAPV